MRSTIFFKGWMRGRKKEIRVNAYRDVTPQVGVQAGRITRDAASDKNERHVRDGKVTVARGAVTRPP